MAAPHISMEALNLEPSQAAPGNALGFSARSPQRELSHRSPVSPKAPGPWDPRFKRISPPKLGTGMGTPTGAGMGIGAVASVGAAISKETGTVSALPTKWNGRTRMASTAAAKPLVPVTERKPHEDKHTARRIRNESDGDKFDITPDGSSAGREGRNFTVSNVGNNGRIYLRPTIRPANQRYPQPNFVFPMTPPGTAGLDALISPKPAQEEGSDVHDSQWTPTSTPRAERQRFLSGSRRLTNHRRALSDSTVHEGTSIARESDVGAFKIVISKPGEETRPRTMDDMDTTNLPLLDIQIPSWKLGTLGFNSRGVAVFRGSSYAPTEENPRSSNVSFLNRSQQDATYFDTRQLNALSIPHIRLPSVDVTSPPPLDTSRLPLPLRSTYLSTHLVIEPTMFDALTFKPACDDRSIVRYSPSTGAVTAATPPRLVAEITSPSFLDYELISDFFLTYRAFLEPSDLLRMLIARLRWALSRNDEVGMVVRVRTFVALRHWILNYFIDDFVVDYNLRVTFCNLLNDLVDELSNDVRARKVQLKILAELKKCWRRVCAQFWDGPEFDAALGPNVPIGPGGIAGHRNPDLDPGFWETDDEPPQLEDMFSQSKSLDGVSFLADVPKAGQANDLQVPRRRPGTPENQNQEELNRRQTSPTSVMSAEIISCSFPGKALRNAQLSSAQALGAHPAVPSSAYSGAGPVATTPRALVGKRVRPTHGHKRSGSLSDSLREREHAAEKLIGKDIDFVMSLPYAGSLVRGDLMPPGQPFVEVLSPSVAGEAQRQTTLFQPVPVQSEKSAASAMSGQGMRKLIGSVRRALSTRGQGISPTQGNFINISPIGPRGATTNRLPGTAIVPQARPRHYGMRPPVRIDLLGAEIAEDFKKAVREEAAVEADKRGVMYRLPTGAPMHGTVPGELLEYSGVPMCSTLDVMPGGDLRPTSEAAITSGSKSIVIVDDTVAFDSIAMAGALPAVNPSVEAFADSFIPTGAAPTPPTTPPGHNMGTPRRSSYLLNQHVIRPSLSADPLPPFILDVTTLDNEAITRPSRDADRPKIDFVEQSPRKPPLTGSARVHRRRGSSRTNRSLNSIIHRRVASYNSTFAPHSTIRSFDATTYSEGSILDDEEVVPQPLRVLRRRPGGDLRAATNVGELDPLPLHRARSVGSLTTYSESLRSSYLVSPDLESSGFVDVASSNFSNERAEVFSLGALAEAPPKRDLSLFSTHSSKPIMRPSFEAEAQKLAQIPDDADDDGGVEAALLKLEGKFEKKPFKLSMQPVNVVPLPSPNPDKIGIAIGDPEVEKEEKKEHRHLHVIPGEEAILSHHVHKHQHHPGGPGALPRPVTEAGSFLSDNSQGSYSSIPLLERGLTDGGRSKTATREWTDMSVLQDAEDNQSPADTPRPLEQARFESPHPSYEFVRKTESLEKIRSAESMPPPASEQQSFLNVESDDEDGGIDGDDGSDLSSELSADVIGSEELEDEPGAFPPMRRGASVKKLPSRLTEEPSILVLESEPPSPPMTLVQALRMSPETAMVPELLEHQVWQQKPLPPTPDTTPTDAYRPDSPRDPMGTSEALRGAPKVADTEISRKFAVHLPFILAFDSDILAQQFTLIEKDALNEIDWKELIDMGWKNATNNDSRSWVDFLRNTDAHGVEVVIARFNIMVKWAASEIVLTQDVEERARCIIKFIHIAAHCRRYRNFATMSQITIALTSQEVSRLTKTWVMVPPHDLKTLHELEALVTPTRNFYNLRAEMEGGSDTGCIPFVGIYTHDLLFNAQRPSEIASSPTTAPLVNFERCRMAATIIKTLLRLLEASTLYQFQPVEGITERCLWMSALTDEEIRKHSESLQ